MCFTDLLYSRIFFPLASSCLPVILSVNTLDFTVWNTPRYIWSFVLGIVFLKDSLWLDTWKNPNQTTLLDQIQYSQWEKKLTGKIHHINVRVFDCLVPFHRKIGANATTYIPTCFFKLQESFKSHRCFLSEPFPVYGSPSWNLASRA